MNSIINLNFIDSQNVDPWHDWNMSIYNMKCSWCIMLYSWLPFILNAPLAFNTYLIYLLSSFLLVRAEDSAIQCKHITFPSVLVLFFPISWNSSHHSYCLPIQKPEGHLRLFPLSHLSHTLYPLTFIPPSAFQTHCYCLHANFVHLPPRLSSLAWFSINSHPCSTLPEWICYSWKHWSWLDFFQQ